MDKLEYAKFFRSEAETVTGCANTLHDVLMRFATPLSPQEQYAIGRGRAALKECAEENAREAQEIERELAT